MNNPPTEQQLRELFAADAAGAPDPGGLVALTLHRVRRRRRARRTAATALIAAVIVIGGSAIVRGPLGFESSPAAAPTGVGGLPGSASEDCNGYSLVALAANLTREGGFALDGTVTGIRPGVVDLGPEVPRRYTQVTFRVQSWYHGGAGETVDVLMDGPGSNIDSSVQAYGVGTRLLVSGVLPRIETASGAQFVTADTSYFGLTCGFTRYHDEATAAEWAAVAAAELPAGPLPAPGAAGCSAYSPALVAGQDFALDGTVTDIGEQRFAPLPGETDADYDNSVTLRVHAWYRGGAGETVTLHMDGPFPQTPEGGFAETYAVGTRLLVAGELSDVEGRGLIGQGCGLTRYYDPTTAAEWAAATD
ncbi:hypothetical protein [Geodermatophilus sp. FMUSA9-8]|uniref:hypothetical protein n=1 Tax=Geodermatophilus sp. FMUSA9-8 TaxID=3120155 RepID=UPI003008776F